MIKKLKILVSKVHDSNRYDVTYPINIKPFKIKEYNIDYKNLVIGDNDAYVYLEFEDDTYIPDVINKLLEDLNEDETIKFYPTTNYVEMYDETTSPDGSDTGNV